MKDSFALSIRWAESSKLSRPNPQLLQDRFRRDLNFSGEFFFNSRNRSLICSFLASKCCSRIVASLRIKLVKPHVVADVRHVAVDVRTKVAQRDQRIGRRMIFDGDSGNCSFRRDEYFVLRHLAEADRRWAINRQLADQPMSLGYDQAGGALVTKRAARS